MKFYKKRHVLFEDKYEIFQPSRWAFLENGAQRKTTMLMGEQLYAPLCCYHKLHCHEIVPPFSTQNQEHFIITKDYSFLTQWGISNSGIFIRMHCDKESSSAIFYKCTS